MYVREFGYIFVIRHLAKMKSLMHMHMQMYEVYFMCVFAHNAINYRIVDECERRRKYHSNYAYMVDVLVRLLIVNRKPKAD